MICSWRGWSWKLRLASFLAMSGVLIITSGDCVFAQIKPDNTLPTNSRVTPLDDSFDLPIDQIDDGTIRGANLFHSFLEFNVGEGRGAYFTNPTGVENILSRVTGNDPSDILGTLGVLGNANLFLMNPNGVIFGPNASLDVGGSFVATTANAVQLGNAGRFSASEPASSNLLSVNPSALFFNAVAAQEIVNQSTATTSVLGSSTNGLQGPIGRSLLLVGGDVRLDGGKLIALGGRVELGGLAGAGTVGLNIDGNNLYLNFPNEVARADVSLANKAFVAVPIGGGGDIAVNARNLDISGGSSLRAGILPGFVLVDSKAGDIEINAIDSVKITGEASDPSSIVNEVGDPQGPGALGSAGDIFINTGSLEVIGNAQIGSLTNGQGDAGRVTITASDRVSLSGVGSGVASIVGPSGEGNGADVTITAQSLDLSDNSSLLTSTLGKGNSGNIRINATDSVSVSSGAGLGASSASEGNAGNIIIDAPDATVSFDGFLDGSFTGASTSTGLTGQGGDITITAKSLRVTNGASLFTGTAGQAGADGKLANAGNILVNATDFVTITSGSQLLTSTSGQGNAGNVTINAPDARVSFDGVEIINFPPPPDGKGPSPTPSGIVSKVLPVQEFMSDRQGGNITVKAGSLSLKNGAQVDASTSGKGDAGDLTVRASEIELVGSTGIAADGNEYPSALQVRVEPGAEGDAGNLTIEAERLSVRDGAVVAADTASNGDAGSLLVQARDSVEVVGTSVTGRPSLMTTAVDSDARGNGGDLTIEKTGLLSIRDGAHVSAATSGQGRGGDIRVQETNSLFLTNGGRITSLSTRSGNAGNISINLRDDLQASNGEISASSAQAGGGNIDITAPNIRLRNRSPITTSVFRGEGGGGNITVNSDDTFIAFDDSDILANAERGSGGNITIDSPRFLAEGFGGATAVGRNPGDFSQFRGNGRVDISASSQFGTSGTIVAADSSFLQNSLTPLSANFISPEQVVAGSCLARRNGEQGSFVVTGTGGLPRSPYEAISGQYTVTGVQPIQGSGSVSKGAEVVEGTAWKKGDPIHEAQGMVVTADGRTIVGTNPQLVALAKTQNLICHSK